MPPKGRGRGAARGRGGRGVASSARPAAASKLSPTPAPPASDAERVDVSYETDSKPAQSDDATTEGNNASIAIHAQNSNIVSAPSISSPSTTTELPAPPPPPSQQVERTKSIASSSQSTSPSTRRGSSSRGRKPTIKPAFTGRRSKQEREALEKVVKDREKERQREREAEEAQKIKEKKEQERRRNPNNRGRGGYNGLTSGPFSLGSAAQDKRSSARVAPSGSRATQVKREYHDDEEKTTNKVPRNTPIKREDGGYVSSDDDEGADYPRKDIDLIEISSEDEVAAVPAERRERPRNHTFALPVRIGRKEHQDRVVEISAEGGATLTGRSSQSAHQSGVELKAEGTEGASRKGKGKAKDVEITAVRKPFKGMWQDAEDEELQIKPEPISDDEDMADAEPIGISELPEKAARKQQISSPDAERKPKARGKAVTEPLLLTDEDRLEVERYQRDHRYVRTELGPEADAVVANEAKQSVRDDHIYVFQIPPQVPAMQTQDDPKEPPDAPQAAPNPQTGAARGAVKPGAKVANSKRHKRSLLIPKDGASFRAAQGGGGKLRVHESGRTTFVWRDAMLELNSGHRGNFFQEGLWINMMPREERTVPGERGESGSFGRVKGKFVVVPSWGLLG